MNKPSIRFKSNLIPLILNGEKTLTYRKGEKYASLEKGDVVGFIDSGKNEKVGKIIIIGKSYTTFKELPFDTKGHEIYKSKEHQKEIFESYYGEMDDSEKILVLKFKTV